MVRSYGDLFCIDLYRGHGCLTQCSHSSAWSKQWPGAASKVSLSSPHLQWVTTEMTLRASLCCVFLCLQHTDVPIKGKLRVPPQPKELHWPLHWQNCVSNPHCGRSLNLESRCSKTQHMQTWNHSLSPNPVWHLPIAINIFLWCPGAPTNTDRQVIA